MLILGGCGSSFRRLFAPRKQKQTRRCDFRVFQTPPAYKPWFYGVEDTKHHQTKSIFQSFFCDGFSNTFFSVFMLIFDDFGSHFGGLLDLKTECFFCPHFGWAKGRPRAHAPPPEPEGGLRLGEHETHIFQKISVLACTGCKKSICDFQASL